MREGSAGFGRNAFAAYRAEPKLKSNFRAVAIREAD